MREATAFGCGTRVNSDARIRRSRDPSQRFYFLNLFNLPDRMAQRHTSLYFFDGNIALMAPNNFGENTIFRVHQSILSHYSSVFADMLTMPPVREVETYDDVPLVCLPDNAEEIESLLKTIYLPR
jgi:hypothetical protein